MSEVKNGTKKVEITTTIKDLAGKVKSQTIEITDQKRREEHGNISE